MTEMPFRLPDPAGFPPLPIPDTADGAPRGVGVEIEFGGLTEAEVAAQVAAALGGSTEPDGPRAWRVEDSRLGTVRVELDTAWRDAEGKLSELGLDFARAVVPVEIVTAPLAVDDLPALDALCRELRAAGATGSRMGALLGFGVHFNPEIVAPEADRIARVLTAYALLEDWLRARQPINATRRLLPFVDPYPPGLLDALAARPKDGWDLDTLADAYLGHVGSRNHGLDMLPLLAHLRPDAVHAALGEPGMKGARPTYHFRLPDSRIDEPGWSLSEGWAQWVTVERVAEDAALLDELCRLWRARGPRVLPLRPGWAEEVGAALGDGTVPA